MGESSLIGRPTFGGLATGLDTSKLLDGLLQIERQPLDRMNARRAEVAKQRSLMRDLNTKLLALQSAAEKIDNRNSTGGGVASTEEFLRYVGSSTNEDVVDVSAGAGAAPGDIDIVVTQLARGSRRFSESFTEAGANAALSAGQSITIALPNGDADATPPVDPTSITIDAATDLSLADLRDQINTSADNGGTVRADILRVGDDDLQLVLTTTGQGTQNQLSVSGDLAFQVAAPEDDAQDAIFTLFGKEITRSGNSIDDVLTGVTFELHRISETDEQGEPVPETVTIEVDVEEVAGSLEDLATAYNDVVDFIDKQFAYNESTKQAGPLAGDSTLRSIQARLRDLVSQGFSFSQNPNNPFASGAQGGSIRAIGVELGSGGRLSVDRDKLEEALALDPLSVREFLAGRAASGVDDEGNPNYDPGFAQSLAEATDELVRSGDGTLAQRDAGFAQRLDSFDDSIQRLETRLGQREETLIQRFSALESIVAGLQSQQGFLSSIGN